MTPRPAIGRGIFLFLPPVFQNRAAAVGRGNLFDAAHARRHRSAPPSDPIAATRARRNTHMAATACLIALAIGGLILIVISELMP
jgi:hypothetical protein